MKSFLLSALIAFTLSSAIGAVYARHESRKLFVELQRLEKDWEVMMVEWGQLQLEESTLTTHGQIEKVAFEQMNMKIPAPQSVVILHQ